MARARRISQIVFLALFVVLLFRTAFFGSLKAVSGDPEAGFGLKVFFQTDPLAGALHVLASRALYEGLWWSLAILIPTFFLGRFYCGWICPLGTLNQWVSRVKSPWKRGARLVDSNRFRSWQRAKYYVLFAVLGAAALGSGIGGVLDPIAITARALALAALPAAHDPLAFCGCGLAPFERPHYQQSVMVGLLFAAILAMNLAVTRFWCRAICPLGALLGLASRWSVFGLEKKEGACGDCKHCLLGCQGGDDPQPGAKWRKQECHLCFNCLDNCGESGLKFRFFPAVEQTAARVDWKRRAALASVAGGALSVPLLRANTAERARRIRPPGAVDEDEFLARCIRCGACMKVCPNNALHPAASEAGWEGFWTPVLIPRIGYCETNCTLCGQVCPTGAIRKFTGREKGWAPPGAAPIRLGTAFYDHGRCLPWSMATDCIVCEEVCPTSPKAIYLREAAVKDREGRTVTVRQPYIDLSLCVGCGACEKACPVLGSPAVYVTSVGESRSRRNQIVLKRQQAGVRLPGDGEAPGWKRSGGMRSFDAENLWEYVNGDADRYVAAGVKRTYTQRYQHAGGGEAVVDAHLFGSAEGARKLFESEAAAGARALALGEAGRDYGAAITFHGGAWFVRVVAYGDEEGVRKGLKELARAAAVVLGIPTRTPANPAP